MPPINLPTGSSTQLEPRPAPQQHHLRSFAVHAYLGLAVTLIIVAVSSLRARRRSSRSSSVDCRSQPDVKAIGAGGTETAEVSSPDVPSVGQLLTTPSSLNHPSHFFSNTYTPGSGAFGHRQVMDGNEKGRVSDPSNSESTPSRGVSRKSQSASASRHEVYLWPRPLHSASMTDNSDTDQLRKHTPSPKASTSDDATRSNTRSRTTGGGEERLHAQQYQLDGNETSKLHIARHPPPPPATPATLDKTTFALQNSKPPITASTPSMLDASTIHQPNLDSAGHTSSVDITSPSPVDATAIPRRRSYTKSVAVGIPTPSSSSTPSTGITSTSSPAFSPSSYSPSSPTIPPPPPLPEGYKFVGGHLGHRTSGDGQHQDEIDVQGEIVSVNDDDGDGWRRHTQVYGGGVCLACLANGGGTYGPNVPLEDRRY